MVLHGHSCRSKRVLESKSFCGHLVFETLEITANEGDPSPVVFALEDQLHTHIPLKHQRRTKNQTLGRQDGRGPCTDLRQRDQAPPRQVLQRSVDIKAPFEDPARPSTLTVLAYIIFGGFRVVHDYLTLRTKLHIAGGRKKSGLWYGFA